MSQTSFRYEVFLSFRGSDTRNTFTSHLYEALKRHNVEVFHDTSLPRGQHIATQLSEAIKESKIYVVVFSTHYAHSRWCLEEISQMMSCVHMNDQQVVLPVFLDVRQSDLRSFEELIIANHGIKFDQETVQKWRKALQEVAELPDGLHLQDDADGNEKELLDQIVENIRKKLHEQPSVNLPDPHHVFGIESQVQEVVSLLNEPSDDGIRVVVISGPAGTGKTQIAKATFDHLHIDFKNQHSCFLPDVKTTFGEINGKFSLQKRLISNLVPNEERRIDNYHQGIGKIERMIKNQKVLLVLDDVDNEEQLKILGVNRAVLGRGSKIIVTTRDGSTAVDLLKPDARYEPRLLDENESLEVF
ncbi:hypothetical protein SSX86_011215 [Deinandra increscens subsp. villosa]|uniref:TIR domain-containing protein n=1 Tax=Deinandra increscens subsp. villosa TaxID=3103831 RepID=A0AAP0H105_9ASTR